MAHTEKETYKEAATNSSLQEEEEEEEEAAAVERGASRGREREWR